jgi:hypothetical protein
VKLNWRKKSRLNVGLGIAPGSSLVKDSYELIFGTNMVTGEELSELERGIALVGVGVGVVSFGSAGGVATTLLRSKKLVKLADHFWNVSAKFLKTSKDVFDKALVVGENVVEGAWKYIKNLTSDSMRDFGEFLGKTLKSEAGQSLLHEPFGEFVEKVAKGVGSKDGVDFVKGIPNLKYKGKGTWVSEAGLEYGLNRTHQNTLRHILKHSKPDLSKPVHSVFSTDIKNIPSVIDSAWLIKGKGLVQRNKNIRYDIPVKGVGTNGEDILTIIIKKGTDNEIVTAFPTK